MSEVTTVKLVNDDEGNPSGYLLNGSMSVPMAEGNRHYKMIQDWIAEGNTPEPADPPPVPPTPEEEFDARVQNDPVLKALVDEMETRNPGFKAAARGRAGA